MKKEQKTLALHYMEGLKIEQVGRVMGVSQPRASCIHTMALRKLRQFIEKKMKGIKVRCIRDFIIWRQAC